MEQFLCYTNGFFPLAWRSTCLSTPWSWNASFPVLCHPWHPWDAGPTGGKEWSRHGVRQKSLDPTECFPNSVRAPEFPVGTAQTGHNMLACLRALSWSHSSTVSICPNAPRKITDLLWTWNSPLVFWNVFYMFGYVWYQVFRLRINPGPTWIGVAFDPRGGSFLYGWSEPRNLPWLLVHLCTRWSGSSNRRGIAVYVGWDNVQDGCYVLFSLDSWLVELDGVEGKQWGH